MSEWVAELGTFLVQTAIVIALLVIGLLLITRSKQAKERGLTLRVEQLNDQRLDRGRRLRLATALPSARKKLLKTFRQDE
ncbi:hypothetical protein, partial [Xanthomonas perforans]|uniref:hypothetical protein n=1 Tax=Xanthomonas perforans TaxID=442694 RepID=UPI0019D047BA